MWQSPGEADRLFNQLPKNLKLGEEEEKILLSYLCCGEAIVAIHELTPELLEGKSNLLYLDKCSLLLLADICSNILYKRFWSRTTQARQMVEWHWCGNGPKEDFYHEIYVLELKRGGRYALDVASAQLGWPEPVHLPRDYEAERKPACCLSMPSDQFASHYSKIFNNPFATSLQRAAMKAHVDNSREIMKGVGFFESLSKKSIVEHLTAGEEVLRNA